MNAAPKKQQIVSKTKWRRVSPTMLRSCMRCGGTYPSTSPADRTCPSCVRALASARTRASVGAEGNEALDAINEIFDLDMVTKARKAKEFDDRKHARRNYARLAALGQGDTPQARLYLEIADRDDDIFEKKVGGNGGTNAILPPRSA
jgi:hypothetical protein